ncbi:hypothetical protein BOO88_19395 [Stutzerimonas stutzeri]|nr:hypothetical protein BOO88_19395 [Stutzerimonas stutzeri]
MYGKNQSSDHAVGVRPLIQLDTIKHHALFSDKHLRDHLAPQLVPASPAKAPIDIFLMIIDFLIPLQPF